MSKEVETLWTCLVCRKSFSSRPALMGHLRIHRPEDLVKTTIRVKAEVWRRFREIAKDHKSTVCVMLQGLMEAAILGEDKGLRLRTPEEQIRLRAKLQGPNPKVTAEDREIPVLHQITLNSFFIGVPRSRNRVQIPEKGLPLYLQGRCPQCGELDIEETWSPFKDGFRSGRCKKCGTEWIVNPKT